MMTGANLISDHNESNPLELTEMGGELTVRDVDLGERLGFTRPDSIRRVIQRNRAEIEGYGVLRQVDANSSDPLGRGRPATEYHLSEEQALVVCQLSRAPNAILVRRMLIQVFTAYRRGLLGPQITPATLAAMIEAAVEKRLAAVEARFEVMNSVIESLTQELVEYRLLVDERHSAVSYKSTLQVCKEIGIDPKGRRSFQGRAFHSLTDYCSRHRFIPKRRAVDNVWLFPVEAIEGWKKDGGMWMAEEHKTTVNTLYTQHYLF